MQATPRPAHQPRSTSWQASKADPFPPIDTTDHRSFIMGTTTIKLSQLRLSPLNQRRIKHSAVEAMADDMAEHGLFQKARNRVGEVKGVSVRVNLGVRRRLKQKNQT